MQIERILYPVKTLGPGNRIGIWTIGCSKHCPKCISPELAVAQAQKEINIDRLIHIHLKIMKDNEVNGITISGGDPLEQAEELIQLVAALHKHCSDIIVYTGYTIEELNTVLDSNQFSKLCKNISVLIDGRYIDELNDNKSPLIGSTNQKIHILDPCYIDVYTAFIQNSKRNVQNFHYNNSLVSVGIHLKGSTDD